MDRSRIGRYAHANGIPHGKTDLHADAKPGRRYGAASRFHAQPGYTKTRNANAATSDTDAKSCNAHANEHADASPRFYSSAKDRNCIYKPYLSCA